ncbi:MAG: SGNH hydrolase domain-containing protein [Pseudomonadota bacterium]|nr:SGNH hydrolase domain-containing protein [Pseudomonadota bacterium]
MTYSTTIQQHFMQRGLKLRGLIVALATGVVEYGKYQAGRLNHLTTLQPDPMTAAKRNKCNASHSLVDCSVGPAGTPIKLIAWGDSHIGHWSPLFSAQAEKRHERILVRVGLTCPPLLGAVPYKKSRGSIECGKHNDTMIEEIRRIAASGELRGVVVSARWNEYQTLQETDPGAMTSWALADHWKGLGPGGEGGATVGTPPYDHSGSVKTMEIALTRTVDALVKLGVRILIIAPVPELYFSGPQCLYLRSEADCVVPRDRVEQRRSSTLRVLRSVAADRSQVRIYDPIDDFCDATTCFTRRNGVLQYTDHNHASPQKVLALQPVLEPYLSWLEGAE